MSVGLLDKLVREAVKNKLTVLGDIPLGKVRKCEFFGGGKSSWNFLKFIRQRTNLCIHEEKKLFFSWKKAFGEGFFEKLQNYGNVKILSKCYYYKKSVLILFSQESWR